MKLLGVTVLLVSCCGPALSQMSVLEAGQEAVANFMNAPDAPLDSITTKRIARLGDAVVIAVSKVVGDEKNLSASQEDRLLHALLMAFANPNTVQRVADRTPKATLDLLDRLEGTTQAPAVLDHIRRVRRKLTAHAN